MPTLVKSALFAITVDVSLRNFMWWYFSYSNVSLMVYKYGDLKILTKMGGFYLLQKLSNTISSKTFFWPSDLGPPIMVGI